MNIAVIPARGGSKRIPRKNVKSFGGRPMIAWAIGAALDCHLFDKVVVSTDDSEIAEIAREYGAETPFVRPAELANDTAGTVPVIAHALRELDASGINCAFAACIYPCTPFLRSQDLIDAYKLLTGSDADFVYPVIEYPHPTFRAMRRKVGGQMEFVFPECEMMRTQDLEATFHDAGQFYWGKSSAWVAEKRMHTAGLGMVVPSWRFVDIDNDDDWRRAELLFKLQGYSA
jgi:pseudaminic acid cytidylyltransferase